MPETAVYENYLASAWEYQIRLAGKAGNMKPVAITKGMNQTSNRELRLRVLRMDGCHDERTLAAIYMIRHSPRPPQQYDAL